MDRKVLFGIELEDELVIDSRPSPDKNIEPGDPNEINGQSNASKGCKRAVPKRVLYIICSVVGKSRHDEKDEWNA